MGYGSTSGMLQRLTNIRSTEIADTTIDKLAQGSGDPWTTIGVPYLKALRYQFMTKVQNPMYFGTSGAGVDVTFYSTTAGSYLWWDESALSLFGAGKTDFRFTGSTAATSLMWDASAQTLYGKGKTDLQFTGSVAGTTLMWDASAQTLYGKGKSDFRFTGSTAGTYVFWDASADDLRAVNCDLSLPTAGKGIILRYNSTVVKKAKLNSTGNALVFISTT